MKCLIVDDDEMSRISLEVLLRKVEDIEISGIYDNALDAMEFLKHDPVDLLFLDIEMPTLSGLDLVRTLKELPLIIFVTAKREYAADVFEYRDFVVDYISKPVAFPKLVKAINKAREINEIASRASADRDYFFVRSEGRLVRIKYAELLYMETIGDYVRFQTHEKGILVHSSLKGLQEKFSHPDFLKVHRSYIVNMSHVIDIEEGNLVIGKKVIPISRANRVAVVRWVNPI